MTKNELRKHLTTAIQNAALRSANPEQLSGKDARALLDRMIASDADPAWVTVQSGRDVLQNVIATYRRM